MIEKKDVDIVTTHNVYEPIDLFKWNYYITNENQRINIKIK